MDMNFGKAISGGQPLSDDELETRARDQISALVDSFAKAPENEKTTDVLSRRLAEELRLVQRMLELVEQNMKSKGNHEAAKEIQRTEEAIEDIAEVVEADDRCDAIEDVDEDLARRLTRRAMDGRGTPCDNRRPSIRRKVS